MARFERSTILAAPVDAVWEAVERPATLTYVARGWLSVRPVDPPALPARWPDSGSFRVAMRAFGVLPLGTHVIEIERPSAPPPRRALRDNGHGALVTRWDHLILVEPAGPHATRYTDRLEIEAGALTLPVTLWARGFYAHRQRRWHRLVAEGLRPG